MRDLILTSQEGIRKKTLAVMTRYARLRDMPANRKNRDTMISYLSGMEILAREMGVDCVCHLSGDKSRPICSCQILPGPGDRGLKLKTYTPKARRR